tara:strand:- start:269 stop:469 length:201 start_codon:yes stop_codon:yes gene_type:complete
MLDGYGMSEETVSESVKLNEKQDIQLLRLEQAAAANCPGWRMCYRHFNIKDKCQWCERVIEFLRGT